MAIVINDKELSALKGLPHLQQVIYLFGIRPYVDYQTGIVGIKRGISYQSLSEAVYIEPHPGIQSGSPNKDQLRRALKGLDRAKIIRIESNNWKLIVHCLLVIEDNFAQNKVATKPPLQSATNPHQDTPLFSGGNVDSIKKDTMEQLSDPATPLLSVKDYCIFLSKKFDEFWTNYPNKTGKKKAWAVFQNLNPNEELFTRMLNALNEQIEAETKLKALGQWVPNWKHAANWIAQCCWEDEIDTTRITESTHATHQKNRSTESHYDFFWESCKSGADYDLGAESKQESGTESRSAIPTTSNVIEIATHRRGN